MLYVNSRCQDLGLLDKDHGKADGETLAVLQAVAMVETVSGQVQEIADGRAAGLTAALAATKKGWGGRPPARDQRHRGCTRPKTPGVAHQE